MRKLLVAFYDKKTNSWSDIVTCPNTPTACRMAEQITKRDGSIQNQYPGDFDLYEVAEFTEDDKGVLTLIPCNEKIFICSCADFLKVVDNG